MRNKLDRPRIRALVEALSRSAPRGKTSRIYLVGGATAVLEGWRDSTIDADLHASDERILRDVQEIKERLELNVELVRPEDFVPGLSGAESRHVLVERVGALELFHYDPYSQLLSKIVRGFAKDLQDARSFLDSGMVDASRFRSLVRGIPRSAWTRYPALSRKAVEDAVETFLREYDTA